MKSLNIFIIGIATLSFNVNAQTLHERIQSVGKIYLIDIHDGTGGAYSAKGNADSRGRAGIYLVVNEADGLSDWSNVAQLKIGDNTTAKINDSRGEYQGEVKSLRPMNWEFTKEMNATLLDFMKKSIPPETEIIDSWSGIGDQHYFILEFSSNEDEAPNQWIIERTGQGKGELLFCYNSYKISLREMSPDHKSPKEVFSLVYKVKYSSVVAGPGISGAELLELTYELEKKLNESALESFDAFASKSQKKINKSFH